MHGWLCSGRVGVPGVSPLFVLCKYLCKQAKCIMCPVLSLLYFQKANNKWPKVEQGAQSNRKQQAGGQEDMLEEEVVVKEEAARSNSSPIESQNKRAAVGHAHSKLPLLSFILFHSPGLYVCLIVYLFPYRPPAACIVFGHKLFGFRHVCHYAYAFTYSYSLCCFLAFDLPAVCRLPAACVCLYVCVCVSVCRKRKWSTKVS